jgi:Allene oxide cyclase barrel like domain
MSRKTRTTAVALAAGAALASATVIPSLGGAQAPAVTELTLKMKVVGAAHVKHAKNVKGDKLAPGDLLVVRLKAFGADGAAVGSAYTECTNVGKKASSANATLQCTQTYNLRDGQIVTAGVIRFSAIDDLAIPIVGGSGAYRGATGEVSAGAPEPGFDSVDLLRFGA